MAELPLAGRRVLVTRAAHQAGKLSDGLRALGAVPVEVPVLEIAPPDFFDPLDKALLQIDQYDWVIFTSANTVRALAKRGAEIGVAAQPKPNVKVAAVGEATAAAAREAGWSVTLVPESYVAESLVTRARGGHWSRKPGVAGASGCGPGCDSGCAAGGRGNRGCGGCIPQCVARGSAGTAAAVRWRRGWMRRHLRVRRA